MNQLEDLKSIEKLLIRISIKKFYLFPEKTLLIKQVQMKFF